jgi:hypothetical protein
LDRLEEAKGPRGAPREAAVPGISAGRAAQTREDEVGQARARHAKLLWKETPSLLILETPTISTFRRELMNERDAALFGALMMACLPDAERAKIAREEYPDTENAEVLAFRMATHFKDEAPESVWFKE